MWFGVGVGVGSITESNLPEIHNFIRAKEYHGRKIVGNLLKE